MTVYTCYLCGDHTDSIEQLGVHFKHHKFNRQLMIPVRCCQEQCSRELATVFNLLCHHKSYHSISNALAISNKSFDADESTEKVHIFDSNIEDAICSF